MSLTPRLDKRGRFSKVSKGVFKDWCPPIAPPFHQILADIEKTDQTVRTDQTKHKRDLNCVQIGHTRRLVKFISEVFP